MIAIDPRPALKVLAGLIGAALLIFAAYHFITGPRRAREEAAQSRGAAITADAGKAAAQDAVHIIVDTQAAHGRIDLITQGNADAIRNAPGADAAMAPAVHSAGLDALRLRDAYRLQPAVR